MVLCLGCLSNPNYSYVNFYDMDQVLEIKVKDETSLERGVFQGEKMEEGAAGFAPGEETQKKNVLLYGWDFLPDVRWSGDHSQAEG